MLMQNYSKATEYATTAQNSSGSAMKKMEVYENSIEAATKRATAAWESFSSSVLSSDLVKFFINLGAGALNLGTTLGTTTLAMTALTVAFIAFRNSSTVASIGVFSLQLGESIPILGNLTKGLIAATGASGALATAMDLIPLVAIVGACVAAYKAFDYFNVTIDEQKQKIEELSTAYDTSKSDLEKINTELKTAQDRIDELNAKPKLTFVEQGELEKLQETTKELKLQQTIAENNKNNAAYSLANANVDLYNKQYGNYDISQASVNTFVKQATANRNSLDNNNISALIASYQQFTKLKNEAINNSDSSNLEKYNTTLQEVNTQLNTSADGLLKIKQSIEAIPITERSAEQKKVLTETENAINLIMKSIDPDKFKSINFDSVFNTKNFESVKNELTNLAKQGKLTAETLNDPKYSALVDAFNKVGISAKEAASQIGGLNNSTQNSGFDGKIVTSLSTALSDLSSKTKAVSDGYKDFQMISDVVNGKLYLTTDQIVKLTTTYPDLAKKIKLTTSGWTLESGAIDIVSNAISGLQTSYITAQQAITSIANSGVQSRLSKYGIELSAISSLADALQAIDANLAKTKRDMTSQTDLGIPHADMETDQEKEAGKIAIAWGTAKDAIKSAQEQLNKVTGNKSLGVTSKADKSAESNEKKAAQALKDQYEAELKVIEANKEQGKYDSDKMSYYRALSSLQQKWSKTSLDSEDKLSLQTKVYEALKTYQQDILDTSYKELQNRIDLGVVQENSKSVLQNLLEIQKNLNSSGMSLVNTEENRLALAKKIYDVQKAMREQDKTNIDNLVSETESMLKQQYDDEKERHQTKLDNIKSEYEAEQNALDDELDGIKEKISLQKEALQQQEDAYKHNEDQVEKEKVVAELQSKIAIAKNDTSDAGIKNTFDLQNQLATAQKDLTDFQRDYSITQQQDALNKAETAYEKEYDTKKKLLEQEEKDEEEAIQKKIDRIEKYTSKENNIRTEAINLINQKSQSLYNDLIAYNVQYGDKTTNEMNTLWVSAYNSLESYNNGQRNVLSTLEQLTTQMQKYVDVSNKINSISSSSSKTSSKTSSSSNSGSYSTYTIQKGDTLSSIAKKEGTTLAKLLAANSGYTSGSIIYAGNKLKIPKYETGGIDTTGGLAMLHGTSNSIETIFNATDGKKLYDFIHNTPNITTAMINKIVSNIPSSSLSQVTNNSSSPNVNMEINILGNADSDTVNQLKKSIPDLVYKAINKANTGTTTSIWRQ